jgi:hypothetical protein
MHFSVTLWVPIRLCEATPEFLKGRSGSLRDMSRRALNRTEVILNTYFNCTLSPITQRLNVSEHMLIWTFFLVLVC